MSFGVAELDFQECVDEVPGHRRSHRSTAHAKNVHVIVLHPLPRRKVIVYYRCANTRNLVGADRRSYAAAADGDAALDLSRRHSAPEWDDKIRVVIVGVEVVCPEIGYLVACRPQLRDQLL